MLTTVNLRHAASRIWTCPEPEFRPRWMKLCSSDNHYTIGQGNVNLARFKRAIPLKFSYKTLTGHGHTNIPLSFQVLVEIPPRPKVLLKREKLLQKKLNNDQKFRRWPYRNNLWLSILFSILFYSLEFSAFFILEKYRTTPNTTDFLPFYLSGAPDQ